MDERGIRTTSTGTLDWSFRNKLDSEGRKDEGGRINSLVTKTRDPEREGRGEGEEREWVGGPNVVVTRRRCFTGRYFTR